MIVTITACITGSILCQLAFISFWVLNKISLINISKYMHMHVLTCAYEYFAHKQRGELQRNLEHLTIERSPLQANINTYNIYYILNHINTYWDTFGIRVSIELIAFLHVNKWRHLTIHPSQIITLTFHYKST